jgi:hypothetical protein
VVAKGVLGFGGCPRAAVGVRLGRGAGVLFLDLDGWRCLERRLRPKGRPEVRVQSGLIGRIGFDQRVDQCVMRLRC